MTTKTCWRCKDTFHSNWDFPLELCNECMRTVYFVIAELCWLLLSMLFVRDYVFIDGDSYPFLVIFVGLFLGVLSSIILYNIFTEVFEYLKKSGWLGFIPVLVKVVEDERRKHQNPSDRDKGT